MSTLTHLIVLDFEATCDDVSPPSPQEIIEFPSVMLAADTLEVVDEFESFVRPTHHPTLTRFCKELTGITQADVDAAPPFAEVLQAHLAWLRSHGLPVEGELPYAFITCGDWDLQTMLPMQLRASDPPFHRMPPPYRRWINVKVPFKAWQPRKGAAGMARMLELLGLELEGRHHRGIDDCRNIAKIVRALVARRQVMKVTTELSLARHPPLDLWLEREDAKHPLRLEKRALATLLGAASDLFRRQASRAFVMERQLVADADLFELEPGTVIRVE